MELRGLIVPEVYTSSDLSGMSTFNNWKSIFSGLDEIGRRHFIEWVVPDSQKYLTWDKSYFDEPYLNARFTMAVCERSSQSIPECEYPVSAIPFHPQSRSIQ